MEQLNDSLILPSSLRFIGQQLQRPECVLCTRDGSVFTSNWQGGITHITARGEQRHFMAKNHGFALKPNGFAITKNKTFLIAHLGDEGGVWELSRNGDLRPFLNQLNGKPLPPCNYVMIDANENVWISVSTRHTPRALAYKKEISDGYIVRVQNNKAAIMAENLGYTNEIQISPCQQFLYANETFGRKLSRFALQKNGTFGPKEVIANFGKGIYPDGLCFDEKGDAWVTSIISNRVIRITRGGSQELVLQDYNSAHVLLAAKAFDINRLDRQHLDTTPSVHLKNISSLAFGGPKRNIAYLGCLLDSKVALFDTNTTGLKPYHWDITL